MHFGKPFSGAFCAGLIEAKPLAPLDHPIARRFPALFAPASLKPVARPNLESIPICFPALFAPASLKLPLRRPESVPILRFSGAFCAGLIEAARNGFSMHFGKPFSGAFCAGLIEAKPLAPLDHPIARRFPALFAPASLKPVARPNLESIPICFPALFAPASLKHVGGRLDAGQLVAMFSGAFCAGLIEASTAWSGLRSPRRRFPALFAPASLKHCKSENGNACGRSFPALFAPASLKLSVVCLGTSRCSCVFRRFLRRPH